MFLRWYDIHGIPHDDVHEFEQRLKDFSYRRVGRSKILDAADPTTSFDVSTVWMGLDYRFGDDGPPLIFETMIWPEGSQDESDCQRWPTLKDAQLGHTSFVCVIAAYMTDPIVIDVPDQS